MAITIVGFEWDDDNRDHLRHAHPDVDLVMLEEIVRRGKRYIKHGPDRFGKMVYSTTGQGWRVYFNIKPGRMIRIFSGNYSGRAAKRHKKRKTRVCP